MATNQQDYLNRARSDLEDPNPPATIWSDADLLRHLMHAVTEYQIWKPLERLEVATLTAGSRALDLTALPGLIRVLAVEYPTSQWPPAFVQFQQFATTATLFLDGAPLPADPLGVNLYCLERHTVNGTTCTIDPADDEAIGAGIAHFAAAEYSFRTAGLVNVTGPQTWLRYRDLALDKAAEFRGYLAILRDRLQTNRAYAPSEPKQSRYTVEAPWRG